MKFFELIFKDKKTNARAGVLHTSHGEVQTPIFMPVGTQASVKSLTPTDLQNLGAEIILNNTYHLYLRPGADIIEKLGGVHKFQNWPGPILTDSGGFQVFSLGLGKITKRNNTRQSRDLLAEDLNGKIFAKIDEEGVTFRSHLDGSLHRFTPEVSIKIQHKLGADIILAFDECTPYPTTLSYAQASLERTHRWARQSLDTHKRIMNYESRIRNRFIFGIVQGGVYEDLRKESAKFIDSLDFDGVCIGGVSVGETKKEMYQIVECAIAHLSEEKPRHLLGVGEIDDLFECIERGIDMFDCVAPTRLARNGTLYVGPKEKRKNLRLNIYNSEFKRDQNPIDKTCGCYTCQNFTRAYLNHLFRAEELLAYHLASIHNVYFVVNLVKNARQSILEQRFLKLKESWLD